MPPTQVSFGVQFCPPVKFGRRLTAGQEDNFFKLKMSHAAINRPELKRGMEKREEKLDKEFVGRKIATGVGPWRKLFD
jgi:hypothetical protein